MLLKRCVIFAAALIWAMPSGHVQAADKATLLLNWYLYAEHAPFFLGKERGYFDKEGIDLDIQEGRGSVPTVQAVAAGTATFGYADMASVLRAADKGAPVEVVGVLLQKSPMAFISLSEKNIRKPQDLRGKSLALTPGDSLSQLLPLVLGKVGMKESDLMVIAGDNRAKLNAVINAQADAMLGYSMDQNLKIAAATQKPVTVLPFADYGVNLASSSIVVARDTASEIRIAIEIVTANSRNRRPMMPPIIRIGMNTAISEMLIDSTVKPTSPAPLRAASIGDRPSSIWRVMFSSTTMASSTTKPVATVNAISDRLSRL